jgi:phenylalanyl-tRNA synthetase beta subunit
MANKELGVSAASAMNKFKASVEQLKVALAPVGEMFLKIATPFIDFATTVLKAFNSLPDGIKQIIDIQEKLHLVYGRDRKKLAIGIYPLEAIKLPIAFQKFWVI